MSIVIPTLTDPFYSIKITLDGVDYNLDFNYATREERWYMTILDIENTVLLSGIKLVCQYPLYTYQKDYHNLPPGVMIVGSGTNNNSPPTLQDLGADKRCQLIYYPITQSATFV